MGGSFRIESVAGFIWNTQALRNSARNDPLNDLKKALWVGSPDREKSDDTPFDVNRH